MKVTLRLSNGWEVTFTNVKDVSIPEKEVQFTEQIAQKPEEGKWFKINPLTIDQSIFATYRIDRQQEEIRQLILEAFEEMKINSKYSKPFKTYRPKKTWSSKKVEQLEAVATLMGHHMADWVEQALEFAQRIANGELWYDICNKKDMSNWFRLIRWKDRKPRLVGSSCMCGNYISESNVEQTVCRNENALEDELEHTIPLVVSYDE